MGHLERWVSRHQISESMILDRLDQISCPGGESVQEMRDRVDCAIAKVGTSVA
jgi:hypothetical protein